ncbi:SUZ domain-containing protein 1 [Anthonomus grandis grandis]|uniref:SUZ domain-containing protein 1 n=1 Tax=Anthonomus grandis grandis TaxID=2921223 RepID=UPI0021655709|nr:SUZ domain-containing protein 1 [Anthonomus grandis grandis]
MGPIMAAKKQDEPLEIDNWEEIEETDVLEKKFNNLIMPSLEENSINGNIEKGPIKVTLTGEDALRSQYVPSEPTVKILKRPVKEDQSTSDNRRAVPKKTLQQREQAYAEARLRILGEASSEKQEERLSIAKPKASEADTVVRMPRGPDGTQGFNTPR